MEQMTAAVCPPGGEDWSPLITTAAGLITAATGLVAAYTALKVYEVKERIRAVQNKVGANRRAVDGPPPDEPTLPH